MADISINDVGTPYLISRNLNESQLRTAITEEDRPKLFSDADPYVYILRVGGQAEKIHINNLTWEKLNPARLSNKILHPGDPLEEVIN